MLKLLSTAVCALLFFSAIPVFAQASLEECTPERKPDDSACEADAFKPTKICDSPKIEQPAIDLETLRGCANSMQNCACALIGSGSCTSISKTGELVLSATEVPFDPEAPARTKKVVLDPATGEVMIKLDRDTAEDIRIAATYTTDAEIDRMKLEKNELHRLTSTVALLDSSRRIAAFYTRLRMGSGPVATNDTDAILSKEDQKLLIEQLWAQITSGIESCDRMHMRPVPGDLDGYEYVTSMIREKLICTFRQGSDLANRAVLSRWPGCACDDGKGRMIGNVCVTAKLRDAFAKHPIDERIPQGLAQFVKNIEASSHLKVKDIGLIGCGFERFETGSNVKKLPSLPDDERMLRASHISDHARATACDLTWVTFRVGCKDWSFNMTVDLGAEGKRRPFYAALVDYLVRKKRVLGEVELMIGKKIVREGVGKFYREAAQELDGVATKLPGSDGDFSADDESALQLKMGILIRNALVDSGFIVFDPTVNTMHRGHLHFETPAQDDIHAALIKNEGRREETMNPYLMRAAGLRK